ncbi:hypothetical protein HY628_02110 [Candidatus Uhrbacteria bacterium]|nr:hypothetical protein [Candidatus Uhrbacteria bacterium]
MAESASESYRSPAKTTVRDHWVPFVTAGLLPESLNQLRVWFLPGPEALEVPKYRNAGLRLEQLLGFEWLPGHLEVIRKRQPELPVIGGALERFLRDPRFKKVFPDWAYLDFDGSAHTFEFEVGETIRRMRFSLAPRFGLTSQASRDRPALVEGIKTMSLWVSLAPHAFEAGIDRLRQGNEEMGLILDEPAMTYALCRELAVSLLLIRSFGERSWGPDDAVQATAFAGALRQVDQALAGQVGQGIERRLGAPAPLPMAVIHDLRTIFEARRVPVRLKDRLRFAYHNSHNRWRWTWYFRFEETVLPVSLAEWIDLLLLEHPALHVVDFTGAIIGNRTEGVCPWCFSPRQEKEKAR